MDKPTHNTCLLSTADIQLFDVLIGVFPCVAIFRTGLGAIGGIGKMHTQHTHTNQSLNIVSYVELPNSSHTNEDVLRTLKFSLSQANSTNRKCAQHTHTHCQM